MNLPNISHFQRSLVLCSVLAVSANAEESVWRIIFPSASPLIIVIVGSTLILILGIIVAWEIFKSDRQKKEKVELSWQNFGDLAQEKKLRQTDIHLLKEIVRAGQQTQADAVFQVPSLYEKCLAAYITKKVKEESETAVPYEDLKVLRAKLDFVMVPVETQLASTRQLTPGLPVTMRGGLNGIFSKAKVKLVDERCWSLEANENTTIRFEIGQAISIWFIRAGDAEYRIESQVLDTTDELILLEHSLNLQRKQLRNWVRVDVNIPCRAALLETIHKDDAPPDIIPGSATSGRILDISGGGACIRLEKQFHPGALLSMTFDLPGAPIRNLKSKVISSNPVNNGDPSAHIHRLKFDQIEISVQEKIIRFVFEKNRMDTQFR